MRTPANPLEPSASYCLTLPEVAALLRMDAELFRRKRAAMQAGGFPGPLDIPARQFVWSRAAVLAWVDRQTRSVDIAPDFAVDLAAAGDRLARQLRGVAA